jgi:hypothetical protein
MMQFGALVIGWILAGLVMAKFVRGKTQSKGVTMAAMQLRRNRSTACIPAW